MARYTGKVVNANTYNVKYYGPLDTRLLVPTYADLMDESNWTIEGFGSIAYNGMIVAVGANPTDVSKVGLYYLFDRDNPRAKDEPVVTNEASWHKLCDLDQLNTLAERVTALENEEEVPAGVTAEELEDAITALRAEIINAGYLTAGDLDGYATTSYVDEKVGAIVIPDISGKADRTELTTEVNNLNIKIDAVDSRLETIEGAAQNHDNALERLNNTTSTHSTEIANINSAINSLISTVNAKADQEEVNALSARVTSNTEALESKANINDVVTKDELATKADQTAIDDLSAAINTKVDNNTYTSKVEEIESGLASKIDTTTVEQALANKADVAVTNDLTLQIGTLTARVNNTYTKSEVDTAIANAQLAGGEVDLTGYYTKDEVDTKIASIELPTVPTKVSELENDANYITEIPSEYITETELNDKGYLTEHQDISGKADVEHSHTLAEISDYVAPDLSDYATKDELDAYATDEELAGKADKATTLAGYGITDTYTKTELDKKLTEIITDGTLDLEGFVSEDEWNVRVTEFAQASALVTTQEEVDAIEADLSNNYSTTAQVQTMINSHVITSIEYGSF